MIFFRVHCGQGDRHEDIREDQENTDLGGVQGEVQQPRGVRALQVQGGGDTSVLIITVDRLMCPGSPEHEAEVVLPHEDRSQVQERLGLRGQVLLHAR